MGITWVHEDSQEAFFAGTESVPAPGGRPTIHFVCPFCTSLFADFAAMQRHASSVHHLEQPLLMWGEREVGRYRKISSRRTFGIANCTSAFMAVDGSDFQLVGISDLLVVLGSATDSVLRIRLENHPDRRMAPAIAEYRLDFRIADRSSLMKVEEAFREHLVLSSPTPDRIRIFLEDPRCSGIAGEYAAGLYAYVHALLLKEGVGEKGLISDFAMHIERFGECLQKLEGLDRKLARSVCALVRLIRNDISDSSDTGLEQLKVAYGMLRGPGAYVADAGGVSASDERLCPIDHGTSRIIALANRLAAADHWSNLLEEECRSAAGSPLLHVDDHRKVFAYWAVTALRFGDQAAAYYPLTQIASIYPFDGWAAAALAENGKH